MIFLNYKSCLYAREFNPTRITEHTHFLDTPQLYKPLLYTFKYPYHTYPKPCTFPVHINHLTPTLPLTHPYHIHLFQTTLPYISLSYCTLHKRTLYNHTLHWEKCRENFPKISPNNRIFFLKMGIFYSRCSDLGLRPIA